MFRYKTVQIAIVSILLILFSLGSAAFSFNSILNVFHKKKHERHYVRTAADRASHVKVGVYLLHVGKCDLQQATTQMSFYVIFQCTPLCSSLNFEILNSSNADIRLVSKHAGSLVYRVQADLTKTDNLRNYPFDSHALDIIIEDKQLTRDKMEFEADPATTGLDENISVVGYQLLPTWTARVSDHYYKVLNQTFSSYKFSIFIKRPWLAGIFKGILPALIMVCCSFLTLYMKVGHSSQRIGIATSTLITVAVFHLTLMSSLPPLGYITYADMFMLVNYLSLFAILIEVVLTSYFLDTRHGERAENINKICAVMIPSLWFFLQILTWILFNPMHIVTVSGS